MYTLLIVDDEKAVCDTISDLIDWESLNIRLIGTAGNGIEALQIILDEYPDIVMTDIKMPGLSGLELIGKIKGINPDTEFIVLTGFGEFEYAQQAMQFGIRHYLLKPCDEKQIIESICQTQETIDRKKYFVQKQQRELHKRMEESILDNFLQEGVYGDGSTLLERYRDSFAFFQEPYILFYVFYLEQKNLKMVLEDINCKCGDNRENIYVLYVKNTLMLLGKHNETNTKFIAEYVKNCNVSENSVEIEYRKEEYESLYELMNVLIKKVRRYEYVFFGRCYNLKRLDNQIGIYMQLDTLMEKLCQRKNDEEAKEQIYVLINNISNADFLYKVASNLLVNRTITDGGYSIAKIYEILNFLRNETDIEKRKQYFIEELERIFSTVKREQMANSVSGQIEQYVNEHLQDAALSLKWIAENILYMNVDYVSRKFQKETGKKFSAFLSEKRIERAKELLVTSNDKMTMNEIAEQIGCGNNPQYFGQLFKKMEHISPTIYKERYGK